MGFLPRKFNNAIFAVRKTWWFLSVLILWELLKARLIEWVNAAIDSGASGAIDALWSHVKVIASAPLWGTIIVAILVVIGVFLHAYWKETRINESTENGNLVEVQNEYIPLPEAARILYEDLREFDKQHWQIRMAQNFSNVSDGILNYFAIVIFHKTDVWGQKPPSTKMEILDQEERERGSIEKGGNNFHYYGEKTPEYINMTVKSTDIPPIFEKLKSQTEIDYGPPPEEVS